MKNYGVYLIVFTLGGITTPRIYPTTKNYNYQPSMIKRSKIMNISVHETSHKESVVKKILSNGMTVLVRSVKTVPKVSIQLWYDVGSRDEKDEERGIAHLIEHMIFKGTETMLSESDINMLTHKLSGYTNAFTSYDYTGYLFNFPTENWKVALPVMADCMQNCRFDDQMLNSEMKAVIQELKMYRDKYVRSLVDEMMAVIFSDHPYHHPIIGYKQDLWSVSSENLKAFYRKHYHPGNATLVVVGDVNPDEVFGEAEQFFGAIESKEEHQRDSTYFTRDIISKSVTLYRDVQQPTVLFAFLVPGIESRQDNVLNILSWILGKGKSSRLYRIIVDELHLATSLSAESEELYQHGLFLISCEPKDVASIPAIKEAILKELADLIANGPTVHEMNRSIKQTRIEIYELLEDIEQQAYEIGKYYQATGDENYLFNYLNKDYAEIEHELNAILKRYFRPTVMQEGLLLPLPESEKGVWEELQEESDTLDQKILERRERTTEIEDERYANTVEANKPPFFDYPKPSVHTLPNGLTILMFNNENTPKIDLTLHFKARSYNDPENKQGLYRFVSQMLTEGTHNYSAQEFADVVESRGISLNVYPGGISMNLLNDDFEFGMELLDEMIHKASFDSKEIEKVRAQLLTKIKRFWDEPSYFSNQLIQDIIYKNHPYHKNSLGTIESISDISRQDLINFYKEYLSPAGAVLAIVGDISKTPVTEIVEKVLGSWKGTPLPALTFPSLVPTEGLVIEYPINRDQVVLSFAALSVNRLDPDYDKLLIFNQIFGGGSLGSMNSRLFQLREQSGLFYTINGSLTAGSDEQPGLFLVRTIVSLDRLEEAEKAIVSLIKTVADSITEQELDEAKRAVISSQVDLFESNESIASAFLFLKRFGFAWDFFDTRAEHLSKITLQEVKDAAHRIMNRSGLITLRVGRLATKK
jgi:zinc protease